MMIPQRRIILALAAVLLLGLAFVLLIFALWPVSVQSVQATLEPALFAPP